VNATARLQQQFQDFVVAGNTGFAAEIVNGPRADAHKRLAVYANAYRSRLTEVLQADYPALRVLAGDDLFVNIAYEYIAAHPSTLPNARWFGRHLASFIRTVERFASPPGLADMAAFEWAMGLAFDAADAVPLPIAQLAALPAVNWPALRFVPNPSLQRVYLMASVPAYHLAVERGETPPAIEHAVAPLAWIIWRRGLGIWYRTLEKDEAWGLDAACAGRTFAELCGGLAGWHEPDDVPLRAVALLTRWIEEGLLQPWR